MCHIFTALLLLDEPTTGLDSFTAHSIIQTLTNLAKNYNKIVLLSIHQPRSDIFNLFDKIALLSLGEMVYFGPRSELVPYFTETGYPCPTYANPLDHYGKCLLSVYMYIKTHIFRLI